MLIKQYEEELKIYDIEMYKLNKDNKEIIKIMETK